MDNTAGTVKQMDTHIQDENGQRQRKTVPEAAGHVCEFWIGRRVQSDDLGLPRHAAYGTVSGSDLVIVRMHGAGVDCSLRNGGFRRILGGTLPIVRHFREPPRRPAVIVLYLALTLILALSNPDRLRLCL